jgi:two-component system, NtrC family, sensor kinase
VAGQWRIRHKLMLGLGLVVGVMAILLGGTVYGLRSYRLSSNTNENKFGELSKAQEFKEAITELARGEPGDPARDFRAEQAILCRQIEDALDKLSKFHEQFQDSVNSDRYLQKDRYNEQISSLVAAMNKRLADLKEATNQDENSFGYKGGRQSLRKDSKVKAQIDQLVWDARDLQKDIYEEVNEIKTDARHRYTMSFWIVGTTSVLSVLLMAGLLRFFYTWVFHPVRDLMEGVSRVSQANFEQIIEVKSGDEMQDLAAAFNIMTGRLREIYRSLAQQVNERSRQLVRSERLASVGFLAAGVAHEINNPLASIAFCSEALEARLAEILAAGRGMTGAGRTDSEVIFKYLKMIQDEAFRCKEITQKLLEFSRTGERRREPTDLGELIQSVLDVTKHLQNHKGKRIVFDPPPIVTAWVNSQEVKSVVLNLVVNALDSMEDGGTLMIGLRPRDGMAEMTFRDNGCGMTAEVLENIFEPFFTRSLTGKGTGLGLTISHRIVTGHGGEIEATSAGLHQGSTFTVRLPLQRPADDQGSGNKEDAEVGKPELLFRQRNAA